MTDDSIGFMLSRALRRWRKQLDERLKARGITYATWSTLVFIQRGGDGMLQRELAAFMDIEAPTLVRHLDHLEGEGLVERRASPTDRRAKSVFLTRRANRVLGVFQKIADQTREELLAGIASDDVERCQLVLEKIISNADGN